MVAPIRSYIGTRALTGPLGPAKRSQRLITAEHRLRCRQVHFREHASCEPILSQIVQISRKSEKVIELCDPMSDNLRLILYHFYGEHTMATDMIPKQIHWPKEWIKVIDKVRGDTPFAEFVRECVRQKIGKRKLSATAKRGRPKSTK